jgi:sugar lactone lactonase YvrE
MAAAGCHSAAKKTIDPPPSHAQDDMSGNAGSGGSGGGGSGGGGGDMPDMALPIGPDFATVPSTLTIVPLTTSLAFGQRQQFNANRPVSWSVVEAGGGQIATDGVYTAPSVAGVFHVHAVATDGSPDQEFATVNVSEHALTFVAGSFGGPGDADGVGSQVRFEGGRGMAYDGSQFLYIADGGAIRRLDVTTNAVTTIAGKALWWNGNVDGVGPAAKFGEAWALALDGNGGLYVSDFTSYTLRLVDLKTHMVTTVAGQAGAQGFVNDKGKAAQFRSPAGLALDRANNRLFIADTYNGAIRIYDLASTQVSTLTPNLGQPDGLVYDGKSTIYEVEAALHQVWTVDATSGAAAVLAGSQQGLRDGVGTAAHFTAPSQLTLEGGTLYAGDTLALRKIDLSTQQVSSIPVNGETMRSLVGVLGDGQGNLFAIANSAHSVLRVNPSSGAATVLAGPDGVGTGNVDGVGAAARFSGPADVSADSAGTLYVDDYNNGEVRSVSLASGQVATLVGSPFQGGDIDGVGRKGRLSYATSLASDHAGTLFIVEPPGGTIRKWVAATNTLSTLAGRAGYPGSADGVGSAAQFNSPVAACVDGGALYVSDQNNRIIRKITIASGAVETIAGLPEEFGATDDVGSAARFALPWGIACDGAGFAYVADEGNYAIRRINLSTKTVDTPVGMLGQRGLVDMPGNAARFSSPTEIAYANGYLYVVDNGSVSLNVRKVQVGGAWNVQTIATSSLSQQDFYGITVDGSGNVYVSNREWGSSIVYQVANNKTLTQFAGNNSTGTGLTIDGVGAAANFFGAAGMVFDGSAIFVAEPGGEVIRRIDPATAMVTTPIGLGASGNVNGTGSDAIIFQPSGLAVTDPGMLIVADWSSIDQVTLPAGNLTLSAGKWGYGGGTDGTGAMARVNPAGMIYDGAGTIYFNGKNTVRSYVVATGAVGTITGQEGVNGSTDGDKTKALFYWPKGIASDGAGNLYVSDTHNHTIRKVVIATGDTSTFAGTAGAYGAVDDVGTAARFFYPMGIVYDGKGNLYVADSLNGAIRKIEIATRKVTTYVGVLGEQGLQPGALPAHLNTPQGLALLKDGGLAVTDEQAVLVIH